MDVGSQGRLSALKAAGGGADVRLLVAARCGIYMLLGGVMSCSRVLGDGAPFGMAMVACSGPGISGVFALTGAALGYLLGGGLEWGIRYIAAAVLVYTVSFVFHELEAYKSSFFMPTAAGLVMGLTGFLGSFSMSPGQLPAGAALGRLRQAWPGDLCAVVHSRGGALGRVRVDGGGAYQCPV